MGARDNAESLVTVTIVDRVTFPPDGYERLTTKEPVEIGVSPGDLVRDVLIQGLSRVHPTPRSYLDPRRALHYHFRLEPQTAGVELDWDEPWSLVRGRYYGVDQAGLLFIEDSRLERLTVADLWRSVENGYEKGDPSRLKLLILEGLGGNGHIAVSLIQWILDNVPDMVVGVIVAKGVDKSAALRDIEVKRLADLWTRQSIEAPENIRHWLEVKDAWSVEEVSKRLAIPTASAVALLTSLGYEPGDRGLWHQSSSVEAVGRRAQWMHAENARYASLNELFDPQGPFHDAASGVTIARVKTAIDGIFARLRRRLGGGD